MPQTGRLGWPTAATLTFLAAASILILEIAAGRLLAPYVGVSLTTYTGIIGAILAGIALGAWLGGRAADAFGPEPLLAPTFVLGGCAAMASVPLVAVAGGLGIGDGPLAIVALATIGFVLPATLLSAIAPMLVRATLVDLATSGSVVGRLSAVGTVGAISGTFATGFILLGLVPTRPLIVTVGAVLALIGLWLMWRLRRDGRRIAGLGLGALLLAGTALALPSPCTSESAHYCIAIRPDDTDPGGRTLVLDGLTHAYVDIADATVLRYGYIRRFADATGPTIDRLGGRFAALHIGGGGFTFPRSLDHAYPASTHTVLELDPAVLAVARAELGFVTSDRVEVVLGDARRSIERLPDAAYDVIAADAFGGLAVPWHLTTREFVAEMRRVLRPGGVLVMNLIDYPPLRFARAELATLAEAFPSLAIIAATATLEGRGGGNVVLVASQEPLDVPAVEVRIAAWMEASPTGIISDRAAVADFIGGARVLTDDDAPVDQLLGR